MTELPEVLSYIVGQASEDDLTRIYASCKTRTKTLRSVRAASVVTGAEVELTNLSPKYLNGLTGKVKTIRGERGDVVLDESSTNMLRFTNQRRFLVLPGTTAHVIPGVPLSSCKVL